MEKTYLGKIAEETMQLFCDCRTTLANSKLESVKKRANDVPADFANEKDPINIVFAGQYSAGKSTLLKILTGADLKIGGGVTTDKCTSLKWNGVYVTDTPGIHTQGREDHDQITYDAISKADLIIYMVTAQGFNPILGSNFHKLLYDIGKGHEMMVVVNKMDQTAKDNIAEQQRIIFNGNIAPVIIPYTESDLYVTYLSLKHYNEALQPKYSNYRDRLLQLSGIDSFKNNFNRFVKDREWLGRCSTNLYTVIQILSDVLLQFKTGDPEADGTLHLINKQRRVLQESRARILEKGQQIIRQKTQQIPAWGNGIADSLTSSDNEDEVNKRLARTQQQMDAIYQDAIREVEEMLNIESGKLQKEFTDIKNSTFMQDLIEAIRKRFNIHIDEKTAQNIEKIAGYGKDAGGWLSKMATGPNAKNGFSQIFRLGNFSGSNMHKIVLDVGHFFGHKFVPWEAVKWAKNIGLAGKAIGCLGAVVGVGLQIFNDKQEDKAEKQISEARSSIRTYYYNVADTINMKFDEQMQCYVEENIDKEISQLDALQQQIESDIHSKDKEREKYCDLKNKALALINKLHEQS